MLLMKQAGAGKLPVDKTTINKTFSKIVLSKYHLDILLMFLNCEVKTSVEIYSYPGEDTTGPYAIVSWGGGGCNSLSK